MKLSARSILQDVLYVGTTCLKSGLYISCIFTVLSFCDRLGWLWSLPCHFRFQYLVIQLIALTALLFSRAWKSLALGSVFTALNLAQILPLYLPPALPELTGGRRAAPAESVVRLLQLNVNSRNKQYRKMIDYIKQLNPDVVAFEEANPALQSALFSGLPDYRYRQATVRWDNFGLLLLSRLPLAELTVIDFPQGHGINTPNSPTTTCRVMLPHGSLTIMHTHLLNAYSSETFRLQNEQIKVLASACGRIKGNLVLVGDLNTTSWCYLFQDLLKTTRLRDSRLGFGVQATWPTIRHLLLIPIDHCLVSNRLTVQKRSLGPFVGSDHYPVYTEIAVPD